MSDEVRKEQEALAAAGADPWQNDPTRDDDLILVDGRDCEIGTASKERTHVEGLLHRAFSVLLVRQAEAGPEVLLAQRALGKYHSEGLWANSCCSHPRAGEEIIDAAYRRVREELGSEAQGLHEIAACIYRAVFANGLCEYEYDHVLIGSCEGELAPDPTEVGDLRWVSLDQLAAELVAEPEQFTAWAPIVLSLCMAHLEEGAARE